MSRARVSIRTASSPKPCTVPNTAGATRPNATRPGRCETKGATERPTRPGRSRIAQRNRCRDAQGWPSLRPLAEEMKLAQDAMGRPEGVADIDLFAERTLMYAMIEGAESPDVEPWIDILRELQNEDGSWGVPERRLPPAAVPRHDGCDMGVGAICRTTPLSDVVGQGGGTAHGMPTASRFEPIPRGRCASVTPLYMITVEWRRAPKTPSARPIRRPIRTARSKTNNRRSTPGWRARPSSWWRTTPRSAAH